MAQVVLHNIALVKSVNGERGSKRGVLGQQNLPVTAQRSDQPEAPPEPSWKQAMGHLKFKLPLRTTKEILDAEAILHTDEQFSVLRNVLKFLLEVRGEIS